MSPDGRQVLFTKKTIGEKNDYRTQLVSASLDGQVKAWTRADAAASRGRWSPEGSKIAFFSKRAEAKQQIHVLEVSGGEARAVTSMPEGDFGDLLWSPDGSHIAFSFRERHPDWTEEAGKKREEKGLSVPPKVSDGPLYRWDGEGFFLDRRHAIYLVDVAKGETRKVYEGCPWGRYSFDWSPDGKRLALKRSFQENLWADPEDDRILILDLSSGAKLLRGQPEGYKTAVRWSPDGKWIAYLGNVDPMDHRGVKNTELIVTSVRGSETRRLTSESDFDLETGTLSDMGDVGGEYLEWLPDSSGLLVSVGWHGENQIGRVSLEGKLELLTKGRHLVTPGSSSADGKRIACLVGAPSAPAEVAVFEKGKLRKLTSYNESFVEGLQIAVPEELWLKADDGYPVHAWVLRPGGTKSARPGVLEIHGGPQAQYGWTYFHEFQVLVSAGYVVVYSNPRGSKGYGWKHVDAISGKWGDRDWADIRAVKDWMLKQGFILPGRIGVMGGSYGGYMVNWAVGHTDDFRAAITDRCVSNLLSKALNSDYPYYPGTYWTGKGYGSLESNQDLWRDSPLACFDRVRTPMLIIHSEGDLRCNVEQGEQVFAALQERGVPARFVRYPVSTSHGMSRGGPPDLRIHRLNEILRWWKKWLG
jgi:dipeptidyl aminopeptidase/acylaminoacyl peptidase